MRQDQGCWSLWWEQTPGPRQLLDDISSTLLTSGTAWLFGAPPWREELHSLAAARLSEADSLINLEFLAGGGASPQEAVFRLIPEQRQAYLPAMKLWDFLHSRQLLTHTILWVYGLDAREEAEPWLELSGELARRKAGFRVVCEGRACGGVSKNVHAIPIDKASSEFDLLLFAMMTLPDSAEDTEMKVYLCRLACAAAAGAPEETAALTADPAALAQSPGEYVLSAVPECGERRLAYAIWRAQVQTAYPAVEQLQRSLVQSLEGAIRALLPAVDDWGRKLEDLDDIELRHLVYWKNQGELALTPEQSRILKLLYKIRNLLSHRQTAEVDDLRQLFESLNRYTPVCGETS